MEASSGRVIVSQLHLVPRRLNLALECCRSLAVRERLGVGWGVEGSGGGGVGVGGQGWGVRGGWLGVGGSNGDVRVGWAYESGFACWVCRCVCVYAPKREKTEEHKKTRRIHTAHT